VLQHQATSQRRPTPSTSWLKVKDSDQWTQKGKQIQYYVHSTKNKPGENLNVQSAKWCYALTRVRFKC